jgi:HAD superfamily hydrolase (TIGR01509 family)
MPPLEALIWDVDGTLAETERDGHRLAFNAAFAELGLAWQWDVARYGELLAVNGGRDRLLYDMAARAGAPASPSEREALASRLHGLKNRHYAAIVAAGHIALRPGVVSLMADCRLGGLPMAIATTTSRGNVDALLQAHFGHGWESGFAAIVCAEDAPRKKPDPQVYQRALERLGLPAPAVLAIEDSPAGVGACLAAQVPVVVTRSMYFATFDASSALATGPGLHSRRGWQVAGQRGEAASGDRVDLELLIGWHARAQLQASH